MTRLQTWAAALRMRAGAFVRRGIDRVQAATFGQQRASAVSPQPPAEIEAGLVRAAGMDAPFLVLAPAESYVRPPARYLSEVPNPAMAALNARYDGTPQFRCPEARALVLQNAVVFDAGSVMTAAGDLVTDTFNIGNRRVVNRVERRGGGRAALSLPAEIPAFSGATLLCKKIGSSNYAHLLLEMLPRIPLARAAMGREFDGLRLLLPDPPDPLGAILDQSLETLGVTGQVMKTGPAFVGRFERLIVPYGLSHHPLWIHPAAVRAVEAIAPGAVPGRRLFVSRNDAAKRRLTNEDAVFARLQRAFPDMERVLCAGLSFAGQRALFAGAGDVVAVMGASFSNLAFAPRGGRAVCIGPGQFTDLFFRNLAAQKERDYLEVRGTPATDRPHAAFSLSDAMVDAIIAFLQGEGRA